MKYNFHIWYLIYKGVKHFKIWKGIFYTGSHPISFVRIKLAHCKRNATTKSFTSFVYIFVIGWMFIPSSISKIIVVTFIFNEPVHTYFTKYQPYSLSFLNLTNIYYLHTLLLKIANETNLRIELFITEWKSVQNGAPNTFGLNCQSSAYWATWTNNRSTQQTQITLFTIASGLSCR